MKKRLLAAALLHALWLGAIARADDDSRPNERARPLFEAGREAYEAGNYREAAEAFERVFAMTGHPFMLRNLGNAYEKLGEREKAIAALHQYLRLMPDAEDRDAIEARVLALAAPTAEPKSEPVATAEPAELHVKSASAEPTATLATLPDRELDEVPAPPPATAPARVAASAQRDSSVFEDHTLTWIALGASAVFAGTAGLFWLSAHSEYDKLAVGCGSHGGCSDRALATVSHSVTATNVMLGLSGAALASAIAFFFIEDSSDATPATAREPASAHANASARLQTERPEREHAHFVPSVDPHGAMLSVAGAL